MENIKYPIGRYQPKSKVNPFNITGWIEDITNFPSELKKAKNTLTDPQLDTPHRENGWTVRQLIHPKSVKMVFKNLIGLYAWHGKHHLAHITSLQKRNNWS